MADLKMVLHWEKLPEYFHEVKHFQDLIDVLSIHSTYTASLISTATGCKEHEAEAVLKYMTDEGLTRHYWTVAHVLWRSAQQIVCRKQPLFPLKYKGYDGKTRLLQRKDAMITDTYDLVQAKP